MYTYALPHRHHLSYTRFLLDALKGRELFRWLDLHPAAWYHAYMYRDGYNWAGLESAAAPAEWRRLAEAGAGAGTAAAAEEEAGQEGDAAAAADDEPVVK